MFFIIPGVCVFWTTSMGVPALGIGDVVDRDCKVYAVLNDMALTGPDPRHPFHVQTQIGRQGRPSARGPKSVATKPRSGRFSVMRLHACRLFQVLLAFRAESLHESPASTVPAAAKCTIDGGNGRRPPCDSERATPRSGALTGLSDGHRSADGYM
jgi:hypothetical protein